MLVGQRRGGVGMGDKKKKERKKEKKRGNTRNEVGWFVVVKSQRCDILHP